MARRTKRFDSLILENDLTGMGKPSHDPNVVTRVREGINGLNEGQILSLISNSGLINRYITALPTDAINKGWTISVGKGQDSTSKRDYTDYIEQILEYPLDKEADELTVADYFCEAQIEANIGDGWRGGACLVLNIDDGKPHYEPVDFNNIKTVDGVYVLGVNDLSPEMRYTYSTYLQNINYYRLNIFLPARVKDSKIIPQSIIDSFSLIHHSRIIRFDGLTIPRRYSHRYLNGWSVSRIPLIYQDWVRYETALSGAATMVNTSSTLTMYVKDLMEQLEGRSVEDVREIKDELATLNRLASLYRMRIAEEGKHRYEYLSRPFNGIESIIDKLRDNFIGSSGMPHTRLFGESPSGLGATGMSEKLDWSKEVASFQKQDWLKRLKKIYRIIMAAKDAPKNPPLTWQIKFHSTLELSQEEQLNLQTLQSGVDSTYNGLGILGKEEIRKSRYSSPNFNYETTLDDASWKKEQEQMAAEAGGGVEADVTGDPKLDGILKKFDEGGAEALTPEEIEYVKKNGGKTGNEEAV